MNYTAGEAASKLGMTKEGLRYYEKEGLLPPIARDKSGHRRYSEADMEWIFLIRCLRDTGMTISKIKQYVSLAIEGGEDSIPGRRKMLKEHRAILIEKIKNFQNFQSLIEKKVDFFDNALNADNPDTIRCTDYADEWKRFKSFLGGVKHG
jgi:DNA-binding transcriptional MerR regulator